MGTRFLVNLFLVLFAWFLAQDYAVVFAQIAPPDLPKSRPNRNSTDDEAEQDLQRLKNRRHERDRKDPTKNKSRRKSQAEQLKIAEENPGPMRLAMSAALGIPKAVTYDHNLKNYVAEPFVYYQLFFKPEAHQHFGNYEFWTGFRLMPLSGTAVYKKTAGRFGFTYFGPMIGLGKVSSAKISFEETDDRPPGSVRPSEEPVKFAKTREAIMWMSGLAALNRSGFVEKGRAKPDEFNGSGVVIDGPGLFTEISYASIHYSRISYNYAAGVQTGKGKGIFYLSFGFGFWD